MSNRNNSTAAAYVIVSENEKYLAELSKPLWVNDAEELVEYGDVFIKFLEKTRLSYQIELCKWTHQWKESILYNKMDAMTETIKTLESLEDWIRKYKESIETK